MKKETTLDVLNKMRENFEHKFEIGCIAKDELWDEVFATIDHFIEDAKSRCVWCNSPYRIEYYWIDRDGNTASFQDEDRHLVATGIAKYCPNCGSKLERSRNE